MKDKLFKVGDFVNCYWYDNETDELKEIRKAVIHCIDKVGAVKIENLSNGEKMWAHPRQLIKVNIRPKIFSNYQVGDKVNVFYDNGKFYYSGIVHDIDRDEDSFLIDNPDSESRFWESPINLRKIKG
jgi:hypothetical protein